MDFNQAVPNDNDGCGWLLTEQDQQCNDEQMSMNLWKDIEDDVKCKIDEELTLFRSRIHHVLNEQQSNMAYMFGIPRHDNEMNNEDFQDCHHVVDAMSGTDNEMNNNGGAHYTPTYGGYNFNTQQNNQQLQYREANDYESEMSSIDMAHHSSSLVHNGHDANLKEQEENKNNCVMRILAATLRINNALKRT